ncbi:hypothetical protein K7472_31060 [Streptomyces sp. PTM05]|uniref:DNA mismatch repair proteins mutS family domain-containing protein n=1 Tax=Streptantibioticus parmotrematis TaxID=2873249 RepID=A0ABS7R1C7_9ACTN|nr:hypothetical protein [Streptantibioticus parmotrematis]MBY8889250.1 hypothetical protein [Streptantibioticus parmotrematis]
MKAFLLHEDADFLWEADCPPEAEDLTRDLGLDVLFDAMAGEDSFMRGVCRLVLFRPLTDPDSVRHRQKVFADCLKQPRMARDLFNLALDAIATEHRIWPSLVRSAESTMYRAVQVMEMFIERLHALRNLGDEYGTQVASPGFTKFFEMVERELDDDYFGIVDEHLHRLKFKNGVLVSAQLGPGCRGADYTLRTPHPKPALKDRITHNSPPSYSYRVPDRDEAGAQALSELRDRGIALAADALSRSTDHILSFFTMLARELAFYVGCLNLHERLRDKGEPLCTPEPHPPGTPVLIARGLYDVCLSLRETERVVGNDIDAAGARLVVVTGANEGGKSTFLRSLGLAQLMAQAGMFAGAESYATDLRGQMFTHYRREEDAEMESGKLDEELARMSTIANQVSSHDMVLFNESFAATNEREGSELARQILRALVESDVKAVIVTHLFDLAHRLHTEHSEDAVFLRAQRTAEGTRTFRLEPGEPLPTGYGEDLYREVFGSDPGPVHPAR